MKNSINDNSIVIKAIQIADFFLLLGILAEPVTIDKWCKLLILAVLNNYCQLTCMACVEQLSNGPLNW